MGEDRHATVINRMRSCLRLLRRDATTSSTTMRVVHLNRPDPALPDNTIVNTRYTVLNFLPLQIYQQFGRPAAFYYLTISTLQLWRTIAPVHWASSWGPLALVFIVTCTKDALDDMARARADAAANARPYTIYRDERGAVARSSDIRVGDLVRVNDGEEVPCDLVLLRTAESCLDGTAHIETAHLDGESNLKTRVSRPELQSLSIDELVRLLGRVQTEPPHADLFRFDAQLNILGARAGVTPLPQPLTSQADIGLSRDQLVQAGTILRRTGFIIGVAVYTGGDTRLAQNKSPALTKISSVDLVIDRYVLCIFAMQAIIILCFGLLGAVTEIREAGAWYLSWGGSIDGRGQLYAETQRDEAHLKALASGNAGAPSDVFSSVILPLRFLLLSSMMVPISLKVSLDLIKAYYAGTIARDSAMVVKGVGARAANSSIIEDLGSVTHVLTDKTGTLTENVMVLAAIGVGEEVYGSRARATNNLAGNGSFSDSSNQLVSADEAEDEETEGAALLRQMSPSAAADGREGCLGDERLEIALRAGSHGVQQLLMAIALCNSVSPEHLDARPISSTTPADRSDPIERVRCVRYESSSPDEEALVLGAAKMGVMLSHRAPMPGGQQRVQISLQTIDDGSRGSAPSTVRAGTVWINDASPSVTFDILAVLSFSSARARMSVIVRSIHDSRPLVSRVGLNTPGIWLITKGADEVVLKRLLNSTAVSTNANAARRTVDSLAATGLRTLLVAARSVSPQEWASFKREYDEASRTIGAARDAAIDDVADRFELGYSEVLGVTALEDALSDRVPETVLSLRDAGIRVWAATGDKEATAIAVGRAAGLVSPTERVISLVGQTDVASIEHALSFSSSPRNSSPVNVDDSVVVRVIDSVRTPVEFSSTVVIDGPALRAVLSSHLASVTLARMATVIAVRVSPAMKAMLVELLQRYKSNIVCAIGDGGNDVAMLQIASVGVGITGREGGAASRASDITAPTFSSLRRLILLHGRYSLMRTQGTSRLTVWKGGLLGVLQVFYSVFASFSGVSLFDGLQLVGFNTFLTALPVLTLVFDEDLPEDVAVNDPQRFTTRLDSLSLSSITRLVVELIASSLIILYLSVTAYPGFLHAAATAAYTSLVFHVCTVALIEVRGPLMRWHVFAFAISFGGCISLALVRAVIPSTFNSMYGVKVDVYMMLTVLLSSGASMMPAALLALINR
jgi:phospholipid-translocating ATPase